jgi:hypothetical protein
MIAGVDIRTEYVQNRSLELLPVGEPVPRYTFLCFLFRIRLNRETGLFPLFSNVVLEYTIRKNKDNQGIIWN